MDDKNIQLITEGSHTTVKLGGSLTLPNAGNIKKALDQAIKSSSSISVETVDVEDADLSFCQIVISLKEYCKKHSINLVTKIELPSDVKSLLSKADLKF